MNHHEQLPPSEKGISRNSVFTVRFVNIILCLSLLLNFQLSSKMMDSSLLPSDSGEGSVVWPGQPEERSSQRSSSRVLLMENNFPVSSLESSTTDVAQQTTIGTINNRTVNVLFGMMGRRSTFIDEWEVALKSILLNAPIDAALHVHIVANYAARLAVNERIQIAFLEGSMWRNPITITIYNVESKTKEWRQFVRSKARGNRLDRRVTLGGYYRLLAYKVIPPETGPIMYMDTDSVITTNLNDLWKLVDTTKVLQVSMAWLCSGFMILHMDKFDQFWEGIDNLVNLTHAGDQTLVTEFARAYPDKVGDLPSTWDANLGNGWKPNADRFLPRRSNGTGYLHFNGFRPDDQAYYTNGLMQYCQKYCNQSSHGRNNFRNSWGLADYYVRVTWPWALYFGASRIGKGKAGYPLQVKVWGERQTPSELPPKPNSPENATAWLGRVATMLNTFRYEN